MPAPTACLRLAASAMATRFELVIVDDGRGERSLRAVGEAALAVIVECDAELSRFRRDGLIAVIEREAFDRPLRLDQVMFDFFAECLAVQTASDGRFDIAVGHAMERWGLHETVTVGAVGVRGPHDRQDDAAPGPAFALDVESSTIRLLRRDARLDLGGVAKGHAIDLAADVLREHGVTRALLHGGTSAIAALGSPPDADAGWTVAIAGSKHIVVLCDEAMCVSAPHGRTSDGHHHIIDPRTGEPAATAALGAVIGPSARTCDAWTKPALMERGTPRGLPRGYRCIVEVER